MLVSVPLSMDDFTPSYGVLHFQVGPTSMTYEGGLVWKQDEMKGHPSGPGKVRKMKHGTGVMKWQDGREYRGQFAFDKMHGEGSMSWPTGAKYVGQYCQNYKGGFGKLTFPDGSSLEGKWHQGMRHGEFLYIDPQLMAFAIEYESDQVVKKESVSTFVGQGWTLRPGYDVFIKSEEDVEQFQLKGQDASCCICMAELLNEEACARTPCKHVFHQECIESWTKKKNKCPLCLRKIPLHKHYDI